MSDELRGPYKGPYTDSLLREVEQGKETIESLTQQKCLADQALADGGMKQDDPLYVSLCEALTLLQQ